jgi:tripartite-type tricarboxylate transporter receptor subunit TctC
MKRLLAALGILWALTGAAAAAYPDRPIQLIVPFPAGGATDVIARLFAAKLGPALGTSIVVVNVSGAGGSLAASQAARAAPDGYTLFFGTTGTLSINQSLYARLPYDPIKDFQPISLIGKSANMLLVNPSVPAANLSELIAYAKAHPRELSYGSAGNGSSTHLAGALLESMAGIQMLHVPYRGSAPATVDLIGGRLSMMFETIPTGLQIIQKNGIRTFGTTSPNRFPATKDIPTIAEAGVPGFEVTIWFAVLGPAHLPAGITQAVEKATATVVQDPEVRARFEELGVQPESTDPAALAALISSDAAKWQKVIREAGITVE